MTSNIMFFIKSESIPNGHLHVIYLEDYCEDCENILLTDKRLLKNYLSKKYHIYREDLILEEK